MDDIGTSDLPDNNYMYIPKAQGLYINHKSTCYTQYVCSTFTL